VNAVGNEKLSFAIPAASGRMEPGFLRWAELQGPNIRELSVQGRSVLWSHCGPSPFANGSESRKEHKERLLRALLRSFMTSGLGADLGITEHSFSYNVIYDKLGKPRVVLNDVMGPSISISHSSGMTWAALAAHGSEVGIDAARSDDFEGDYPLHRVFHGGELDLLLEKTDGNRSDSAALVWSAKEAFVKSLGCAFHFFSPLEVTTTPLALQSDHALLRVRVSDKGLEKVRCINDFPMEITSFRLGEVWVSFAAADRNCIHRTGSAFSCLCFYDRAK
jgi:phosphopantetheinyl transferase